MAERTTPKIGNRLLAALPEADLALLGVLEPVALPLRKQLEQRNRPADHVYFLAVGVASVVVKGAKGQDIEGGVIGNEGMTGISILLGVDRPVHETMIQVAGHGHRMTASAFTEALGKSSIFDLACRRYVHSFLVQVSYTALANGRNNIEERLARWLLMAQDRAGGDELDITHEFLALMLGVRRAGVTLALSLLTRSGLIVRTRGRIAVADRKGLILLTRGSYGTPEEHLEKLLATKPLSTAA